MRSHENATFSFRSCLRFLPSTYSIAMKDVWVSTSSPTSWIVTMFGCESVPAACASRMNRSLNSRCSESSSAVARIVLSATRRPMTGSRPR